MKYVKIIAVLAAIFVITACGSAEKPPYSGIKLGKPYEIYGRWYKPHYDKDYDEIGMASWYGPGFHGGHTANGEKFDQNELTGAHRTLPMPSIVRVTNLDNGMSALVKINDRGPFAHDRIIDLSKAAAAKLGVIRTGTAKVRVQFLERETREYVDTLTGGKGPHYAMNTIKQVDPMAAAAHEEQRQAALATGQAAPAPEGAAEPVDVPAPPANSPVATTAPPAPLPWGAPAAPAPSAPPAAATAAQDIFTSAEYLNAQAADNNMQASVPRAAVAPIATPVPQAGYMVQVGTFGLEGNAEHLRERVLAAGPAQVTQVLVNNRNFYRVLVGPYNMQSDARNVLSKITAMGISDAKIIRN